MNADRAGLGRNKYFEHECIVVFLCCLVYIGMLLIQRFLSESVVNLNHVLQCGHQIDMFRMSSDCKIFIVKCVFIFYFFLQLTAVGDNALLEGDSNPVLSIIEVEDATHPKIPQQVHSCLSFQMYL